MKRIVLILVLSLALCSAEYSKEQLKVLLDYSKQCMQELAIPVDANVVERVLYANGIDRNDMKFVYCLMKKLNFMDEDDNILADAAVAFMAPHYDAVKVRRLVEKCAKQEGPSVYDRLWKYMQCGVANLDFDL